MIDMSDIAIMYAAARVAFAHVFEAYQTYNDPSLDKALTELLSIENVLEKYMEKSNGSEDVQDN